MRHVTQIGLDIAKQVFPIHGVDDRGHTVTDLSINEPTLETVFIKLTGKDLRE